MCYLRNRGSVVTDRAQRTPSARLPGATSVEQASPPILWKGGPACRVCLVRRFVAVGLAGLLLLLLDGGVAAQEDRCSTRFPEASWTPVAVDSVVTVATSGMSPAMADRFAGDVARVADQIENEIGGLSGAAACLTSPDVALDLGGLIAEGQRLHAAAFGGEQMFVLSAVEIRLVDDAIAFGLPHIALHQIALEEGREDGYPEPLASTVGHWYLARSNGRLDRYHAELVVALFLDDPNPEERTLVDATPWIGEGAPDPLVFDPQFLASQFGDFIDYAVDARGSEVVRDLRQETWGSLENEWRVALKDELLAGREGSYGAEWGVAIFVGFILLAVGVALLRRRQKRKERTRRPTPPEDESLFVSQHD